MSKRAEKPETSLRILDVAQNLVQTRGYNAFSYADIAATLHITTASLHYHFPSKAALGHSLIARYEDGFRKMLEAIDGSGRTPPQKIEDYVGVYAHVLADRRMCLCGMLAAEFETLPKPMQSALDHFFELNELWLGKVLEQGRNHGSLVFDGTSRDMAQFLVASLEGAMMLARSHGANRRFHQSAERLLASLGIGPPRAD